VKHDHLLHFTCWASPQEIRAAKRVLQAERMGNGYLDIDARLRDTLLTRLFESFDLVLKSRERADRQISRMVRNSKQKARK
jgi:hypothetical protein